jgi:hypothetical protein
MRKKRTLTACFAHFGAQCANFRWSWSARSPDGKTVVVTMWSDEIRTEGDRLAYYSTATRPSNELGSRERRANLIWARDNCGGLVSVVVVVAKNARAQKKSISRCFPSDGLVMRITRLNAETGSFRLASETEYSLERLMAEEGEEHSHRR